MRIPFHTIIKEMKYPSFEEFSEYYCSLFGLNLNPDIEDSIEYKYNLAILKNLISLCIKHGVSVRYVPIVRKGLIARLDVHFSSMNWKTSAKSLLKMKPSSAPATSFVKKLFETKSPDLETLIRTIA